MEKRNKGGRPRGSISKKRAMAQEVMAKLEKELGRPVNPIEGLLRIGSDASQPVNIRVQCYAEAAPYLYPKLQSQAVEVTHDSPAIEANIDISHLILQSPELVEAAQRLSLEVTASIAESNADGVEEPRKLLPAPTPYSAGNKPVYSGRGPDETIDV